MTTTSTIYGTPDQTQEVNFDFEHIWIQGVARVNFIKLNDVLEFDPSDIDLDMEEGIAIALGVNPRRVRIDCKVEYLINKLQTVEA